jgi:cyclophilin family peptidyl-prolyl cis-trans isomerase
MLLDEMSSQCKDENYIIKHDQLGIVVSSLNVKNVMVMIQQGMANKGPHTNNSQFYITMGPTPWMDRKYVAFG